MKDSIELKSRGDEHNYLRKLNRTDGTESYTYLLKTSTYYMRSGYTEKKKMFIDPSGGPMIVEGEYLEEAEAVVKSINHISGKGYAITFEVPTEPVDEQELMSAIVDI